MKLTLWTYEGPPHIGAMRVASAMRDVHLVLHAPQGDTYADLLFTMIERNDHRPPVSYTTFGARDLGKDTAALFQDSIRDSVARYQPKALLVAASCTAELLQDDPAGLSQALNLPIRVIPLELPAYQRKENWGAAETFYQLVRHCLMTTAEKPPTEDKPTQPSCNILGLMGLGFRHRDDLKAIEELLRAIGVTINVVAPWQASPDDLTRLPLADFNVMLNPELSESTALFLKRQHGQPFTQTIPIGEQATDAFVREVAHLAGIDPHQALLRARQAQPCRSAWYSASVDATYLTGKRVFIFGDASHAVAAARVATQEMGFDVVGLGTYSREQARLIREMATELHLEPLITDDYLEVERAIEASAPDLVLGTQMERHIAKRMGLPCAVISAPVHVQDFPARYAPQMGYEGANQLFDAWVAPLMMGLEEHLLQMFREDFEFHPQAAASHLGAQPGGAERRQTAQSLPLGAVPCDGPGESREPVVVQWSHEAERELGRIPFFVRGKAKRNTERYAQTQGLSLIQRDTLYEAKAFYAQHR
ncbi:MAG: ferredoxin:protochlorophyllide reductase (ATP-dependent) subunit B [Burkholderiaceae bacterium]